MYFCNCSYWIIFLWNCKCISSCRSCYHYFSCIRLYLQKHFYKCCYQFFSSSFYQTVFLYSIVYVYVFGYFCDLYCFVCCIFICTHILCICLPEHPTALQVLLLSYKEDSVCPSIKFVIHCHIIRFHHPSSYCDTYHCCKRHIGVILGIKPLILSQPKVHPV